MKIYKNNFGATVVDDQVLPCGIYLLGHDRNNETFYLQNVTTRDFVFLDLHYSNIIDGNDQHFNTFDLAKTYLEGTINFCGAGTGTPTTNPLTPEEQEILDCLSLEDDGRVRSSCSWIFPADTVFVSDNLGIEGAGDAFSVFDQARDRRGYLVAYERGVDNKPFYRKLLSFTQNQEIQTVKDSDTGSQNYSDGITLTANRLVTKLYLESTETVTGASIRLLRNDNQIATIENINFTANVVTEINIPQGIFCQNGTILQYEINGVILKGTGTPGTDFELAINVDNYIYEIIELVDLKDIERGDVALGFNCQNTSGTAIEQDALIFADEQGEIFINGREFVAVRETKGTLTELPLPLGISRNRLSNNETQIQGLVVKGIQRLPGPGLTLSAGDPLYIQKTGTGNSEKWEFTGTEGVGSYLVGHVIMVTDGNPNNFEVYFDFTLAHLTASAGVEGIVIEDEGTVLSTTATRLNFVGEGVTASGTGVEKTINIPGTPGVTVEDEGIALTTEATTLNFVGDGVTATGNDVEKTITIPGTTGLTVEDEGTALSTEATILNFTGSGVTASGATNEKTIDIPGTSLTIEDEGTALTNPADTLNFVGDIVEASGTGSTKIIRVGFVRPTDEVILEGTGTNLEAQSEYDKFANKIAVFSGLGTVAFDLPSWGNFSISEFPIGTQFAIDNRGTGTVQVRTRGTDFLEVEGQGRLNIPAETFVVIRKSAETGKFAVDTEVLFNPVLRDPATPVLTASSSTIPTSIDVGTDLTGNVYSINYSITNTQNTELLRIVGFVGQTHNPSSVTTIKDNIPTGTGKSVNFLFPSGVSFTNEGDKYTIRMECYKTGQTSSDSPCSYVDFVITAETLQHHEQVHFGFIDENENAGSIDFANDDISTSIATAGDYTVTGIPEGDALKRIYFAVPDIFVHPTAISQGSFNITNQFTQSTETFGGEEYLVFLMNAGAAVNSGYNNTVLTLKIN